MNQKREAAEVRHEREMVPAGSVDLHPDDVVPTHWYRRCKDGVVVSVRRVSHGSVDYSPVDLEDGVWTTTTSIESFVRNFARQETDGC